MSLNKKTSRESGLELLRIIAALGIVFSHFLNDGDISNLQGSTFVMYDALRTPVACAVNLFLVIMGYFSCLSSKRSLGKPSGLLIQMSFYGIVLYSILTMFGYHTWSIKDFVWSAVPYSWFVTLYLVMYFISPYINLIISNLSSREWKWFLGFFLAFYSIWPMILGVIESVNRYFEAWSTIGRCGDYAGYHILTFILMYCVGSFIRLNKIEEKISIKHALGGMVIMVMIDFSLRLIPIESTPWHIARWYSNIFVIGMTFYSFILFKKYRIQSRFINTFATCAFTIYLIHTKLFVIVDTTSVIRQPILIAIATIICFLIFVCVFSYILYVVYSLLFDRVITCLDKYRVPYFDK